MTLAEFSRRQNLCVFDKGSCERKADVTFQSDIFTHSVLYNL